MEAGDVHLDAKNNLVITAPKILLNGEEISNNVRVSSDDNATVLSAPSIKFKSNASVTFRTILNEVDGSVDVWAQTQPEPEAAPPVGLSPTGTVNAFAGATAPDE